MKKELAQDGALRDTTGEWEGWLKALSEEDLVDRYNWNQNRAVPETPNQEESRWRRMLLPIVSNTAEISRRHKQETC